MKRRNKFESEEKSVKKNMLKSCLSLLLTGALAASMSACNGGESALPVGSSAADGGAAGTYTLPASGKYDPPIELTTVGQLAPAITFKNNESIEDNVHTRWAHDRFGIDIKYLWSSTTQNDAFLTRMRLALSADDELPDVVAIDNVQLANDLIDSGHFMMVSDLWEQTASDMYRKAISQDPTMWYPYMRDDGAYGLPIPQNSRNNDTIMYIRTDWLDKLHLEAPTTIDEMETVMDAFVNQDPDGNGQADTVGIAVNMLNGLKPSAPNPEATPRFIFGAFGDLPCQWNVAEDGTLTYGSIQPSAKETLGLLADWMQKGYLHKEAGIHDQQKADELFTSGKAGIIAGPLWMDRTPLKDVMKNVEGATFTSFKVPTGPDGKAGRDASPNYQGAILINKDFDHPEAFMLYYNYLFDNFAKLKAGSEFEYGFAKDYDYTIKPDGSVSYDTNDIPGGRVIAQKYTLTYEGARMPAVLPDAVQDELDSLNWIEAGKEPRNGVERKDQLFNDELRYRGLHMNLDSSGYSRPNMFTGPPTESMKAYRDTLDTMEQETYTKIIYGELPLDAFDTFVSDWKSGGGDQITKEVNDWYSIAVGK